MSLSSKLTEIPLHERLSRVGIGYRIRLLPASCSVSSVLSSSRARPYRARAVGAGT